MAIEIEKLKKILVNPGYVKEHDFDAVERKLQDEDEIRSIEDIIIEERVMNEDDFGKVIANYFGYKYFNPEKEEMKEEAINIIPEVVARAQSIIPFEVIDDTLKIATSLPDNYEFIKTLEKKTGYKIEIFYSTPSGVRRGLDHYVGNIKEELDIVIKELEKNPDSQEGNIIKIVDYILEYAHNSRASDIHIEPLAQKVVIRFRIDGILHIVIYYDKMTIHQRLSSRIKILANLRTDEHNAPQDGGFSYEQGKRRFDLRVSILPVTEGENIVIRILSTGGERFTLEDLGMGPEDLEIFMREISKPHGMVLTVGPTGSGKTTTLYGALQILNKPEVNIMTVEDPVEYNINGVHQTQINLKKGLTFATGLRSLVRQDPDIMMIGEIRDNESASIAINSSMTGHLVLSTLHANDTSTTFPRFYEMGIEPFLLATSINLVIAQRLVRKVCEKCRESYFLTEEEVAFIKEEREFYELVRRISGEEDLKKIRLFKGKGCSFCSDTGYKGRTSIFELMRMTEDIRTMIVGKKDSDEIKKKAVEKGMRPIAEDGLRKVFSGITTIEEVIKAVKF